MTTSTNNPGLTAGICDAIARELEAIRCDWAIRRSTAQNYGQLLEELRSLVTLPAAIIVLGSGSFPQDGLSASTTVAVILVDRFTVSQPGRVAGVQALLDETYTHFRPVADLGVSGYAWPDRFYPVEVDEQYSAMAFELRVDTPYNA